MSSPHGQLERSRSKSFNQIVETTDVQLGTAREDEGRKSSVQHLLDALDTDMKKNSMPAILTEQEKKHLKKEAERAMFVRRAVEMGFDMPNRCGAYKDKGQRSSADSLRLPSINCPKRHSEGDMSQITTDMKFLDLK